MNSASDLAVDSYTAAARLIAFYLPQFHPIPENDAWWGPGFTEWTNVGKAKPLFAGHRQPLVPADLGYYDLRVAETRQAQADMAQSAGIEGFCYWHYWFGNGRRILERPFAEVLSSGEPDLPFCLAWANQSWTGVWHGNPKSVLIEQTYPGERDYKDHFDSLIPAFRDRRYMRVDGKPIFVIFDPKDMPDTAGFAAQWRSMARKNGFPDLYLVAISYDYENPILDPFDAITPLTPQDGFHRLSLMQKLRNRLVSRNFGSRFNKLFGSAIRRPLRYSYKKYVERALNDLPDDPRFVPCVLPNWDNTPRSTHRGLVLEGSTPELFGAYLHKALQIVKQRPASQKIIFVKAWNEWAEGNHLEPDLRNGKSYLAAIEHQFRLHSIETAPEMKGEMAATLNS